MMGLGKITVLTPPDKLHNTTLSYLLVCPSVAVKQQFQEIFSRTIEDINVYIFDKNETDIDWLLTVSSFASMVIIDVDNCDSITKQFVSLMLIEPNAFYITSDEITPYHLLTKNRIFSLDSIIQELNEEDEGNDDSEF